MKSSNIPLKLFVYACIWLLAFTLVNLAIGALNVMVRSKENISSLGFERGMLLVNEQPAGISMQFFFGLSILAVLLFFGYKRFKRSQSSTSFK